MKNKDIDTTGREYIPQQYVGSEADAVEKIELDSEGEAILFFEKVKSRFLDVNRWGEVAKLPMSTFRLTDAFGNEVDRLVTKGDYIKIDIPGPGTQAGEGYDWVTVEDLQVEKHEDSELLTLTARPSANPQNVDEDTAHFLTNEATSTFQVKRIRNLIYAEEHGRNERANARTEKALDNIRNTVVGWAAKLGFSYPQWKSLVKGWLSD